MMGILIVMMVAMKGVVVCYTSTNSVVCVFKMNFQVIIF